jgi:hypothetical protein
MNIQPKFKLGQVVRFKNYKRNIEEKEAYFIVIQEEVVTNEMVLFTLNSNRIYVSGTTIIPEFPEEDLLKVDLRPSNLINEEITIKDTLFNEVVTGKAVQYISDYQNIHFTKTGTTLVSDAEFECKVTGINRLKGPLLIEMEYENNNQ